MFKTIKYGNHTIFFKKEKYGNNGNTAIKVFVIKENSFIDLFSFLSVNFVPLKKKNLVALNIKDYEIIDFLEKNGLISRTDMSIPYDNACYPVYNARKLIKEYC